MFTGIVEEIGAVASSRPGTMVFSARNIMKGMEKGESVSVNGVCLTITDFTSAQFSVNVMPETLKKTNLGALKTGDKVNLEKPLTLEKGLGGHLVQGHIDGTGKVAEINREPGAVLIDIEASEYILAHIVDKGFIGVDGVSLTVVSKTDRLFRVSIVDFTRENTIIKSYVVGTQVNLEIDVIAKYMSEYMSKISQPERLGITESYLKEHGFLDK